MDAQIEHDPGVFELKKELGFFYANDMIDLAENDDSEMEEKKSQCCRCSFSCEKFFFNESNCLAYEIFNFFISILCIVSSVLYLQMASFRDEHKVSWAQHKRNLLKFDYFFEIFFAIHLILNFFKQKNDADSGDIKQALHKTLPEIALNYLKTDFINDIIPLIPLQLLKLHNHREYLFYLIKVMRMVKGFKIYDVGLFMQ